MYWSSDPREGSCWNLGNSPFWPPDAAMSPEEYLGWLRALYRREPGTFLAAARDAVGRDYTLYSMDLPHLLPVVYEALVRVAATKGWEIDGGAVAPGPPPARSLYANAADMRPPPSAPP